MQIKSGLVLVCSLQIASNISFSVGSVELYTANPIAGNSTRQGKELAPPVAIIRITQALFAAAPHPEAPNALQAFSCSGSGSVLKYL